ncbi:esterase family protein [Micromonospora sp. KC723]|uniref:alpha/beta hydrolase n=1 Tax=Micromonospora sp. KC723 TaxID=2530381 RepID=UPI001042BB76|nr:alpha/beta fold hydrolase [Micromonospora sp. KC723]TDB74411.1 esterase [Micromonospora sp. KC723]
MAPDSLALQLLALAAAVVAAVALAVAWERGSGWRRVALRAGTAGLCVAAALAAALVWVNRQSETYTSWSDLTGAPAAADALATPPPAGGGTAGRLVELTVAGKASGLSLPVLAYLPAAYDAQPTVRFPVIEALHGYPASPTGWTKALRAPEYLDQEIAAGRMAPTVVLFPYTTPDRLLDTECTNLSHGPQAETYLTVDVPAAAENQLHVRTDRGGWGLIGYSAGGFCATNLALRHPTRYAAAASLSGYATPGITVGDGSERTLNNDLWRLQHLPQPATALYLGCARSDGTAMRNTATLARLAHAPMNVTTGYVNGGGHNVGTWLAMEPPAFDWLSSWLARPLPAG